MSINIKGLYSPVKSLWCWIFKKSVDIVCIKEQKMHDKAGEILNLNGYTLLFGESLVVKLVHFLL